MDEGPGLFAQGPDSYPRAAAPPPSQRADTPPKLVDPSMDPRVLGAGALKRLEIIKTSLGAKWANQMRALAERIE